MSELSADDRVILVHGWPGLPSDYDAVRDALQPATTLVPDLRGFGAAFAGELPLAEATAEAHARRLLDGLADPASGGRTIIAGYDIGSRIAQAALRLDPSRFDGAVLTPAYPGIGDRATAPSLAPTFWYQHFQREPIAAELIDGRPDAVTSYLDYLWRTWSGAAAPQRHPQREELIAAYSRPGAFAASIQWYLANRGYAGELPPIETPTVMLWPTEDPLFPIEWADRLDDHFSRVSLHPVVGSGHLLPIEAPAAFVSAIRSLVVASEH
ncbi:alpha/beta hydrolase [Pseudoclavibacter sp. RFBJ3]|uniref:alpha/beta fold hydrolase n=1 Tax=unclassified Pseudoclavibacter TaxID=2615177 RepID=UPI000CE7E5A9|nr:MULTISPECIES: alpha/beta hydrolase [unclassified Pseudoclavibacter]PPF87186.1 alpha/beta hydrolase [Pseudoclavibacter sp. RFBJ5]PPF89409.1 alpha/beta hydrolase [Pseudoclavibacter sp. RFBJ3]PPG00785.1 alpha/beta hydrolase [Pseudoclavibacter sp. RFBH5]PPG18893.1 alpha/beta hydrolase [Pseudoclavibacter sp. RFBI4]